MNGGYESIDDDVMIHVEMGLTRTRECSSQLLICRACVYVVSSILWRELEDERSYQSI